MTLTLEVTGESIEDGSPLTSLKLDDRNMLGTEYEALQKIIEQMCRAMNVLHQSVEKCKDDDEQLLDAVQHLEQQISSFEVRTRECEDTCQEIRLQLGTMVTESQRAPEKEEVEVQSDVSKKDLNEVIQKLDNLMRDVEATKKAVQKDADVQHQKMAEIEETMSRHQEFFDDDLEGRLAQFDDDRGAMKAELDAIGKSVEHATNHKASKVEVNEIASHVHRLDEGQSANSRMLQEAGEQFEKLNGLATKIDENQRNIQEMWSMFGKESQELREWASAGFVQLRSAVCTKMGEQEATSQVGEIRKEVRGLAPFLSEAMARVEASMNQKAEASDVQRLADQMEGFDKAAGRPKQLLVGTKCLACDRVVSTADTTDGGAVSLMDRAQQEELWHEVQRSLDKTIDHRQPGQKDVLKYVAIHVGNETSSHAGHKRILCRNSQDEAPGGHSLMRVGGGGGFLSRPQTHSGCDRSPPREMPSLYRVPPRRPGKFVAQPPVTGITSSRPLNRSIRAAVGSAADNVPHATDPTLQSQTAPEALYSPVRMQPGAHSGMSQPQASDYDIFDMDSNPERWGECYVIESSAQSPVSVGPGAN